jgi:hypothetical protein
MGLLTPRLPNEGSYQSLQALGRADNLLVAGALKRRNEGIGEPVAACADPAWKTWFELSQADVEQVAKLANITPAERANPASISYWPNPGKVSGRSCQTNDPKRYDFLRFLNEWFYGTLSGDSHLTFPGLVRRGGFYAQLADGVDLEELHKRARSNFLFEALSIYVAILSEMSGDLRFEHEKTRLRTIWSRLSPASVDAAEFFARRYDNWLT